MQLISELVPSIVFAIFCYLSFPLFHVKVHQRMIPYQIIGNGDENQFVVLDGTFNNDIVPETVASWKLLYFVDLLPVVFLLLGFTSALAKGRERKYMLISDVMAISSSYFYSCGTTELTTNSLKFYIGYLRPNFYKLCGFDIDILACTGSEKDVTKSRTSFPSGHSSAIFCSMSMLTYYLLGRLAKSKCKVNFFMASIFPMGAATFIAASRVHDNFHHPVDVVVGALIGVTWSSFIYHLWYPTIWSPHAGIPRMLHDKEAGADKIEGNTMV